MNRPLISVVTISYNAVEHIERTIQSVINQKDANFEYIVIDGGSIDGTIEIIRKYQKNIKYWHSVADSGISDAFNQGIKKSSGQWLIFINSDDLFLNDKVLYSISPTLQDTSYDVVYGKVQVINRYPPYQIVSKPLGKKYKELNYLFNNLIPHQSSFINADFFKKNGLYSIKYYLCADYEIFLRPKVLNALHIKNVVALISDMGLSRKKSREVVKEWYLARKSNRSCGSLLNRVIWLYSLTKIHIKESILRKKYQ